MHKAVRTKQTWEEIQTLRTEETIIASGTKARVKRTALIIFQGRRRLPEGHAEAQENTWHRGWAGLGWVGTLGHSIPRSRLRETVFLYGARQIKRSGDAVLISGDPAAYNVPAFFVCVCFLLSLCVCVCCFLFSDYSSPRLGYRLSELSLSR